MVKNVDFYLNVEKECRECGEYFEEQVESYIYECQRCFGNHHE